MKMISENSKRRFYISLAFNIKCFSKKLLISVVFQFLYFPLCSHFTLRRFFFRSEGNKKIEFAFDKMKTDLVKSNRINTREVSFHLNAF